MRSFHFYETEPVAFNLVICSSDYILLFSKGSKKIFEIEIVDDMNSCSIKN